MARRSKKTDWTRDYESFIRQAEVADIVEFPRSVYTHVGIYIGNGEVVHFVAEDYAPVTRGFVRRCKLQEAAEGGCVRICNWDKVARDQPGYELFTPEDVWNRCIREVGKTDTYNLFTNNCQTFATRMKYGCEFSHEVEDGATAVTNFVGFTRHPSMEDLESAGY